MSKISVIVPCYNEEQTIEAFYQAITELWKNMGNRELEVMFVDDGSKDATESMIKKLSETDERVRFASFSRNFGKEAAIFCGLEQVSGDCAVVIDADLQHPVETIKSMVLKWEEGFEIVEGVKSSRGKEKKIHGLFAGLFYKLISSMAGFDMANSSDFKLLDRKVIDTLNGLDEKETFFRALTFWVGFTSTTVEYEVQDRVAGTTKWSSTALLKYAVRNITSFTYMPLYIIAAIGGVIICLGLGFGIDAVISYFRGEASGGYPTMVILLMLATGAIMCSLGIMSVYIAKIYEEVKDRPRYIVRDKK